MTGLLFPLDPSETAACLAQAVDECAALTLYWRRETAMIRGRSRFLAGDAEDGLLWIEPPRTDSAAEADCVPLPGQVVGISFNDQTRRVVSDVEAVDLQTIDLGDGNQRKSLMLRWPESMHQFQRRLHYRGKVPHRTTIPIDLTRTDEHAAPVRGLMQDISLGGLGMTLLHGRAGIRWRPGESVNCRFSLGKTLPADTVRGEIRHCEQAPGGETRIGIRFKDWETLAGSDEVLERIRQTVEAYRFADTRRRRPNRRPIDPRS